MSAAPNFDSDLERRYLRSLVGSREVGKVPAKRVTEHQVAGEVFSLDRHRALYEMILELSSRHRLIDEGQLKAELEKQNRLRLVGGHQGLDEVLSSPFERTSPYMTTRLTRLRRLDRATTALRRGLALLSDGDLDAGMQIVAEAVADADVEEMAESHGETTYAKAFAEAVKDFQASGSRTRITSIPVLAEALSMAVPGALITIGGTTGAGKSSLALLISIAMRKAGMRPGVLSLEDPEKVWGDRVGAHYAEVSLLALERAGATPTKDEGDRLKGVVSEIRENDTPLVTIDNPDIEAVKTKMRRLVHVHGCTAIFLDYLQLVTRADMPRANRAQAVSRSAQDLKNLAKRLGVPLFLMSQLSRPKSGESAEPNIFSLKETGDLENMSEAVILLWKVGDSNGAITKGKIAKLKSSANRPRFQVRRNDAGAITELAEEGSFT